MKVFAFVPGEVRSESWQLEKTIAAPVKPTIASRAVAPTSVARIISGTRRRRLILALRRARRRCGTLLRGVRCGPRRRDGLTRRLPARAAPRASTGADRERA